MNEYYFSKLLKGLTDYEINLRLMINLFPEYSREMFEFTEDYDLITFYLYPKLKKLGIFDFIDHLQTKPRRISESALLTYYKFKDIL